MTPQSLDGILRATGFEPTSDNRSGHDPQHRGYHPLVTPDQRDQNKTCGIHVSTGPPVEDSVGGTDGSGASRRARRRASTKSYSTCRYSLVAMEGRATSTTASVGTMRNRLRRKTSRRSRRARLRMTAPPMRRPVTTPNLGDWSEEDGCQFMIRQPWTWRFPCSFSRKKSPLARSRWVRLRVSLGRVSADMGVGKAIKRSQLVQGCGSCRAYLRNHPTGGQTGVSRLRPTRRRLRKIPRPLLVARRARNPCCRTRRILEGWYWRFMTSAASRKKQSRER
jgi:hypothetical protein